jgi:hypothetical protein
MIWHPQPGSAGGAFQFAPQDSRSFFESVGWKEQEFHVTWLQSIRMGRTPLRGWRGVGRAVEWVCACCAGSPQAHVRHRVAETFALARNLRSFGWPVDRIENNPSQIRDRPILLTCKKSSHHPAF